MVVVHFNIFQITSFVRLDHVTKPLLLKNGRIPEKHFFPIFSKNVAFFKKIVKWKKIQNLVSHKKRL